MRRRLSVVEVEAMVEAGIFAEDERFELIGGEIVPMSPKGIRHEVIKGSLNMYWASRLPPEIAMLPETTFRLSKDTFVEPDFVFFRRADGLKALSPATALLAVEVADSSLAYDLDRKTRIYAAAGVREVWVIEAQSLTTHIRRSPGIDGYREQFAVLPDQTLTLAFAPALDLSLGQLELV
ncbi:MAG: Uma2 family endonuclease [Blastochloris sp.]|nr:Uma2 family endonuclease [Blastochloris sp.]